MKRISIALILVLLIPASSYAVNIIDTLLCKRVVLCANHATVLVNRASGEVKYVLSVTGQWLSLTGIQKNRCQAMYDAQLKLKLACH